MSGPTKKIGGAGRFSGPGASSGPSHRYPGCHASLQGSPVGRVLPFSHCIVSISTDDPQVIFAQVPFYFFRAGAMLISSVGRSELRPLGGRRCTLSRVAGRRSISLRRLGGRRCTSSKVAGRRSITSFFSALGARRRNTYATPLGITSHQLCHINTN